MGDVVATIQTEQDRVIRASMQGALVVQGGPGTGKTVAALHRAAYLLYTHRATLERRGVLVVGPTRVPALHRPGAARAGGDAGGDGDARGAVPGGARHRRRRAAGRGGQGRRADGRRGGGAVRERQRVPDGDLEVVTDGLTLRVPHEVCAAVAGARAGGAPAAQHGTQAVRPGDAQGAGPGRGAGAGGARCGWTEMELEDPELAGPLDLEGELDEVDLRLTAGGCGRSRRCAGARRAVAGADAAAADRAAAGLAGDAAGARTAGAGLAGAGAAGGRAWTVDDVPLLDEAAELLGEDDSAEREASRRRREDWQEQELYAAEVLEIDGTGAGGHLPAGRGAGRAARRRRGRS